MRTSFSLQINRIDLCIEKCFCHSFCCVGDKNAARSARSRACWDWEYRIYGLSALSFDHSSIVHANSLKITKGPSELLSLLFQSFFCCCCCYCVPCSFMWWSLGCGHKRPHSRGSGKQSLLSPQGLETGGIFTGVFMGKVWQSKLVRTGYFE